MGNNEILEKAKQWQVGDEATQRDGTVIYVHAFNAAGKPLWRKKKNGGAKATQKTASASASSSASSTQAPAAKPANAQQTAASPAPSKKKAYDAPTPTVTYKQAPDPKVEFRVPEVWQATGKDGKIHDQNRETYRKLYADTTKMDDAKLIKILNNKNGNENVRMLAYEEAMHRGIPENKIDVSGTLQGAWDKAKRKYDTLHSDDNGEDSEEEFITYDMSALKGMDVDAFMEQFPNGDTGWTEKNDSRVQNEFNKLQTLSDRQRYDAFLDFQKRRDPMYAAPKKQLQGLNRQFFFFMTAGKKPLMVSSGGAGAGKTTGFLRSADAAGFTRFDPNKHQPGDGDYDFYIAPKDIDDEKDFRKMLAEHNGKLIVFDDKDKLLMSTASGTVSLMKSIADGNKDMRVFKNPKTGKEEMFTGQLLFITNKTMDALQKDEDHKAIMSRAVKNDARFTINENIELLRDRYKKMGEKMTSAADANEEQEIRQKLFDIITDNVDKLDPDKFTVRKFTEALDYIDGIVATNKQAEESDDAEELFGGTVNWEREVLNILNKAEETDIEKALPPYSVTKKIDVSEMDDTAKKKMLEFHKKNPKEFAELFGDEVLKIINGKSEKDVVEDKDEEEVKKAFQDSIGEMSLNEAEDIIFNL